MSNVPRKSSTFTPKRGFAVREPTSNLAYWCINASDLESPTLPILLPKDLLVSFYPEAAADALKLDAIPPVSGSWDDSDHQVSSRLVYTGSHLDGLFPSAVLLPSTCVTQTDTQNNGPSLKEILYRTIPHDLWAVISSATTLDYSQDSGIMRITIGGIQSPSPDQVQVNSEFVPWKVDAQISALEIVVPDSVNLDSFFKAAPYKAILWLLDWFQGAYGGTIESIDIRIPLKMSSSKKANTENLLSAIVLDDQYEMPADVFPKLRSLHWKGNVCVLPKLLPVLASKSVENLIVHSDLNTFGAQWLLRRFSASKLRSLELAKVGACDRITQERLRPPFALPFLETLKISTSVPLKPLMAQIAMPSLRSVSLHVDTIKMLKNILTQEGIDQNRDYVSEKFLRSFFSDPVVESQRFVYMSVQCGFEPGRVDHIKKMIMRKVSPGAVVEIC